MGLLKYVKSAFLYPWNLLAFLGAMGFAALSGRPDVFCPLVLAGEAAYLGMLGTHPKFQKYVDAREAKTARQEGMVSAELNARRLLSELPENLARRFESLRSRCLELRQLALEMRDPNRAGSPLPFEQMQLAGLDRLLWIYLRLLFTQHSLERFQETTSAEHIERDIDRIQKQLEKMSEERFRKVLEDSLETARARLTNFRKAQENYELVKLEIDRLENKIRSISELAVNRHDPHFISGQVDQVAGSMVQTEQTMGELQFVTGLTAADEAVPEMLPREVLRVE